MATSALAPEAFNINKLQVEYKFRAAHSDRKHLIVMFSGFRKFGTYDFDGAAADGLRANILWIQDRFSDNYSYYMCHGMDFSIRDAVHALIEATRIRLGLESEQVTLAGFSKGGSAALYFGIKYNYGAILATVPQMRIGTYVRDHWPKAFEAMSISSSDEERVALDRLLPALVESDTNHRRHIYLFTSEADIQYNNEIKPYLHLFERYDNFNLVMTDSPIVEEHIDVTRYNVPLILSILALLTEGAKPRLGTVENGSRNHVSTLPAPTLEDVKSRNELVSAITSWKIEDGVFFPEGYGFLKGHAAKRYNDIKWKIDLSGTHERTSYYCGGLIDPGMSKRFFETEFCDYSVTRFATVGHRGIDLNDLPDGAYTCELTVTHSGITKTQSLTAERDAESWGETRSSLVQIILGSDKTTIMKRPAVGPNPSDAYFQLTKHWIQDAKIHVEGYFAVSGFPVPDFSDVTYYLVFTNREHPSRNTVIRMAAAHRPDVGDRLGDPWNDYSKAYYATPRYSGVDLSTIIPGTYQVHVTARFRSAVFSKQLGFDVLIQGRDSNERERIDVGIIGACVSRDNFNSRLSPDWKAYFSLGDTFYQSSLLSLMSPRVQVDDALLDAGDSHSTNVNIRDFSKDYLTKLVTEGAPDLLIIDLFADARFGCLRHADSFVTNNSWKLHQTPYWTSIDKPDSFNLAEHESDYLFEFAEASRRFSQLRDKYFPDTTIILNSARAVHSYYLDGQKHLFAKEYIDTLNDRWQMLDDVFLSHVSAAVISANTPTTISHADHPWGPAPYHYEPQYYKIFMKQLLQTVGYLTTVAVIGSESEPFAKLAEGSVLGDGTFGLRKT